MYVILEVIIYIYWPAPPTIHRGLEWPQFLNSLIVLCLSVLCLCVGKFSHFIQYSTVEYSTVQYKAAGPVQAVISIRYGSKEGVQGSLLVPQYIRP